MPPALPGNCIPPFAGAVQRRGRPRPWDALPGDAAAGAPPGPARSSPALLRGSRSRSPAGVGEFGPGKAAAEIYDAGGQSVKAVYHHQLG